MEGPRNAELQRVLAALRGYSSPSTVDSLQNVPSHNVPSHDPRAGSRPSTIPGLGLVPHNEPHEKLLTPPASIHRQQSPAHVERVSVNRAIGLPRSASSTPTVPDASAITTWPAALKHVTRHLLPNEQVAARIKHLISEQHKHERQWWAGREAIVSRQEGRSGASQQVSALLKSLGGKDVPVAPSDPKANQAELETYDKKVYAGLTAMAANFDRQLRGLGVPFYAIKHELVVLEDGPEKGGAITGRIDKGELRELQKRMLQTLEDLFAD